MRPLYSPSSTIDIFTYTPSCDWYYCSCDLYHHLLLRHSHLYPSPCSADTTTATISRQQSVPWEYPSCIFSSVPATWSLEQRPRVSLLKEVGTFQSMRRWSNIFHRWSYVSLKYNFLGSFWSQAFNSKASLRNDLRCWKNNGTTNFVCQFWQFRILSNRYLCDVGSLAP